MPEARLQRTRESLPNGYQFGMVEVGDGGLWVTRRSLSDAAQSFADAVDRELMERICKRVYER